MAQTTASDAAQGVQGEVRLLIDGKLTEAESGKRFDNINPATEEVLGPVADGSAEDMAALKASARSAMRSFAAGSPGCGVAP